jgi:hypothetical protein
MTNMSDAELLGHQERLSMGFYSHFLKHKQAVITHAESLDHDRTVMDFICPTCGKKDRVTITGMMAEIQRYCAFCCYPVYVNPLNVSHIAMKTSGFITWLDGLKQKTDVKVMVTPVGHEFMRMVPVLDFPMENVTGFLDQSPQRLKHPFMNRPVYIRNEETVRRLEPDTIVVCSFAYQNDIVNEMKSWNIENTEIIPIII